MSKVPSGAVKKVITCPCCNVITAVPIDCRMYLTAAAAGFYPSGYRCKAHSRGAEVRGPIGANVPQRLSEARENLFWDEYEPDTGKRAA